MEHRSDALWPFLLILLGLTHNEALWKGDAWDYTRRQLQHHSSLDLYTKQKHYILISQPDRPLLQTHKWSWALRGLGMTGLNPCAESLASPNQIAKEWERFNILLSPSSSCCLGGAKTTDSNFEQGMQTFTSILQLYLQSHLPHSHGKCWWKFVSTC